MKGTLSLGGPVWLFATTFILVTVVLSLFVLFDSLRRGRRGPIDGQARSDGWAARRFWVYAGVQTVFLGALVLAQVLKGVSLVSAVPVIAAPFAFGFGIAYLLRVVFPKPTEEAPE